MSGILTDQLPLRPTGEDNAMPMGSVSSPTASPAADVTPISSGAAPDLPAEVQQLRERLRVSNEWNLRLQHQIQDLLQLPPSDIQEMRQRMQDPDIAIPLLQCYDAVILEKADEVERLRAEVVRLQTQLGAFQKDQLDVSNAVRMAEELASSMQGKASAEGQRYLAAVRDLQEELVRLRLEMTRALDAENTAKQDALHTANRVAILEKELEGTKQAAAKAEEALQASERRWRQQQQQAGELHTGSTLQKVQLQVAVQENADKSQELERLRGRMLLALRQASENHSTHLRIVEERHRMVVEDLRNTNRTLELEMLKLRAQLARWDPTNPSGASRVGGFGSSASTSSLRLQSTAELLDAQTRQAQEMEVRRLYGEVSALQIQRDDAERQFEQRTSRLQRERDQQLQEAQRQVQSAQRSLSEARARCEELEETKTKQEGQLRKAREEVRQAQLEAQQHRLNSDTQTRKVTVVQQQLADATQRLTALEVEKKDFMQQMQERTSELEKNMTRAVQEVQSTKEHAYGELEETQRRNEQLQQQQQKLQVVLADREAALTKKERECGVLEAQIGRLGEGLESHKRYIREVDQRIHQLEGQLAEARQQQRGNFLSLEQTKLQNAQLTRTRDQLTGLLQTRSH